MEPQDTHDDVAPKDPGAQKVGSYDEKDYEGNFFGIKDQPGSVDDKSNRMCACHLNLLNS